MQMNNQQYSIMPKFNPTKVVKTVLLLAMIVILFTGCFNNTEYNFSWENSDTTIGFTDALKISWLHGLFVWPTSRLVAAVFGGTGNLLFTILVVTFTNRTIGTLLTLKSTVNMEKMKEIQPRQSAIQAKYAGRSDQQSRQMMAMEMQQLYKTAGVNPMSAFGAMFISMPLFISLWKAFSSTSEIRASNAQIFGIDGTAKLMDAITGGQYLYAIPLILMLTIQAVSMLVPTKLSKYRQRKGQYVDPKAGAMQRKTTMMMVVMYGFMSLNLPTTMVFYWMFSAVFTIVQAIIIHNYFIRKGR